MLTLLSLNVLCLHSSEYTRRLYTVYSSLEGSRSNWKKLNCKIGQIETVWLNSQTKNDAMQPILQFKFFSIQPWTICSVYTITPGQIETCSFCKNWLLPIPSRTPLSANNNVGDLPEVVHIFHNRKPYSISPYCMIW